jgi:hypothetical protein
MSSEPQTIPWLDLIDPNISQPDDVLEAAIHAVDAGDTGRATCVTCHRKITEGSFGALQLKPNKNTTPCIFIICNKCYHKKMQCN